SKTIDDCASIAQATATSRDIVLTNASAGKRLSHVQADNTRLKQVLLNLLSNAVKYNRDAGQVTIDATETKDGFMRVSISDTGIGLSEREKKKIFEPFERLGKQSEAIEGTGIGLTITKQLVNLMSGRIGFESEIGKGSTFWIDIPKSDKGSKKKLKRRRSDLEAISTGPIADPERTYSVLCVEDNEDNAKLMVRIFDSISNADLHVAVTGRAGVQYAKKFQPDMILMDINLPDISGIEATKILQRTDATKDIPIIAISASIWRAKNGVTEDVSFHHYVEKPFDVNEIYNLINSVLSGEPK
ncbi:MAG: response regulator, partial [Rhodospirillales bacterium]|nr:response regulator [Rhodospirillales bacterium]